MLKIIVLVLLFISYLDTIQIAVPSKTQTEFVILDVFWSILHTIAYGLAVGYILFI